MYGLGCTLASRVRGLLACDVLRTCSGTAGRGAAAGSGGLLIGVV